MSDDQNLSNNQKPFSLEENLRQRAYYEKYYEDLAAHASKMEAMGQHDEAGLDRQEMAHTSQILGELTAEKWEYEKSQPQSINPGQNPAQETHLAAGVEPLEDQQASVEQVRASAPIQDQTAKLSEVQDEDLIPVDKSHFTEEALESQARVDQQLAEYEAEMSERFEKIQAEIEKQEQAQQGETPLTATEQAPDTESNASQESKPDSPSEEQDYDYGYGM